jgi:hypothetical protein
MKLVSGNEGRPQRESEMKGRGTAERCDSRAGTSARWEWARGSAQQPQLRRNRAVEECLSCSRRLGDPAHNAMFSLLGKRGVASGRVAIASSPKDIGNCQRAACVTPGHLTGAPPPALPAAPAASKPHLCASYARKPDNLNLHLPCQGSRHASSHLL